MTDKVSTHEPTEPCDKCGSSEHSTNGHLEGGSPDGNHDTGGYPTTIGTEKVYENQRDEV